MTAPEDLDVLQLIAHRSPEGKGVPIDVIREAGHTGAIHPLLAKGLLEHVDDETVRLTESGWKALRGSSAR